MSDQPRGMRIVVLALCFTMFLGLPMLAQEYRGSISGTASDPSGAAIPGVTVTITSIERNVSHTTITTEDGTYQFHGSTFFDEQASIFNANTFELNRGTLKDPRTGKARRPSAKIHTYGLELDGPVILPGFNGRDRLFFMVQPSRAATSLWFVATRVARPTGHTS